MDISFFDNFIFGLLQKMQESCEFVNDRFQNLIRIYHK